MNPYLHIAFEDLPRALDCKELHRLGINSSGVYTIYPDNKTTTRAYCDMVTDGGGWTVSKIFLHLTYNY